MRPAVTTAVLLALFWVMPTIAEPPPRTFTRDLLVRSEEKAIVISVIAEEILTADPKTAGDGCQSRPLPTIAEVFTFRSESVVPIMNERWIHANVEIFRDHMVLIDARERRALILRFSDVIERRTFPAHFTVRRFTGFELADQLKGADR